MIMTTVLNKFKAESAGKLMTNEYVSFEKHQTVDEIIDFFRAYGKGKQNIHYIYVVDQKDCLKGVLSLRELLSTPGATQISDIMIKNIVTVDIDLDQEKVAHIIKEKDYVSLPVVDHHQKLLGVIHVDDILDVVQEEATEDFHKMAPVGKLDTSVKNVGILTIFKKRVSWLVILVFMNIFSGAGIALYEDTIAANIALVFFLPLLVDSGGNAGSQSATLIIRAMAVGDIRLRDWLSLFKKEFSISFLLGIAMAVSVSLIGIYRGGIDIAIVVSLTMLTIVVVGSLIGMSLPFIFSKLKLDPATASGPLITSICDISGVFIYFAIASWYLGL